MLQVYAFKGEQFSDVYRYVRAFLYALSLSGISVSLPDGYRSNTKFYPDYGTTMTVVEVFPDIVTAEQVETVESIYADVLGTRETVSETAKVAYIEPRTLPADSADFDPFLDSEALP